MRVNTELNTYARITQSQWLQDRLALSKAVLEEQQAHFAGMFDHTLKGLPPPLIPIGLPRITRMVCQEQTGKYGLRHTIRNITDSKNVMHSRLFAQRKALRYMIL